MFAARTTFPASPGVTSIREWRGTVTFDIVEREKTVKVDATAIPILPVLTPHGKVMFTQGANGEITFQCAPLEDAALGSARFQVYVMGKSGTQLSTIVMSNANGRTTIRQGNQWDSVASLEFCYVEKSREVTLPIRLTDIALPKAAP